MAPRPYEGPPGHSIEFRIPQFGAWLNANDRMHWAQKARVTRTWRQAGLITARQQQLPAFERIEIRVWVHKTTARRYDAMNLYPTFKAFVDGLVDYGLIPDDDNEHLLGPIIMQGAKHDQPGATIQITAQEAEQGVTVQQLEDAVPGSQYIAGALIATKRATGLWGIGILRDPLTSEELLCIAELQGADGHIDPQELSSAPQEPD